MRPFDDETPKSNLATSGRLTTTSFLAILARKPCAATGYKALCSNWVPRRLAKSVFEKSKTQSLIK
ncbi:MAG: hypothetical protein B6247_20810 [Candidatus Parabeggiatoa sp. nov. 2]|nr:MAG: hypothetical protein B6247_20810 [Beggiatoa sp. 4572_84]